MGWASTPKDTLEGEATVEGTGSRGNALSNLLGTT